MWNNFPKGGAGTRKGREAVAFIPLSVKQKLLSVTTRLDLVKHVKGLNHCFVLLCASLILSQLQVQDCPSDIVSVA